MADERELRPIAIPAHAGDDPRFLELIQIAIAAELMAQPVREVFVVRIDKWLGLGARFLFDKASRDFRELAFPPFTPGRVVAEHHFVEGDNSHYDLAEEARLVHSRERSRKRLDRGIVAFSPSALFV